MAENFMGGLLQGFLTGRQMQERQSQQLAEQAIQQAQLEQNQRDSERQMRQWEESFAQRNKEFMSDMEFKRAQELRISNDRLRDDARDLDSAIQKAYEENGYVGEELVGPFRPRAKELGKLSDIDAWAKRPVSPKFLKAQQDAQMEFYLKSLGLLAPYSTSDAQAAARANYHFKNAQGGTSPAAPGAVQQQPAQPQQPAPIRMNMAPPTFSGFDMSMLMGQPIQPDKQPELTPEEVMNAALMAPPGQPPEEFDPTKPFVQPGSTQASQMERRDALTEQSKQRLELYKKVTDANIALSVVRQEDIRADNKLAAQKFAEEVKKNAFDITIQQRKQALEEGRFALARQRFEFDKSKLGIGTPKDRTMLGIKYLNQAANFEKDAKAWADKVKKTSDEIERATNLLIHVNLAGENVTELDRKVAEFGFGFKIQDDGQDFARALPLIAPKVEALKKQLKDEQSMLEAKKKNATWFREEAEKVGGFFKTKANGQPENPNAEKDTGELGVMPINPNKETPFYPDGRPWQGSTAAGPAPRRGEKKPTQKSAPKKTPAGDKGTTKKTKRQGLSDAQNRLLDKYGVR